MAALAQMLLFPIAGTKRRSFLPLVYRLLELLSGAKPDRFRSRDPDSLSGVWVVATASAALRYGERTKADEGHLVVLTQTVGDSFLNCVDCPFGLCLADRSPLRNLLY